MEKAIVELSQELEAAQNISMSSAKSLQSLTNGLLPSLANSLAAHE